VSAADVALCWRKHSSILCCPNELETYFSRVQSGRREGTINPLLNSPFQEHNQGGEGTFNPLLNSPFQEHNQGERAILTLC
jgi:hypothetical protein